MEEKETSEGHSRPGTRSSERKIVRGSVREASCRQLELRIGEREREIVLVEEKEAREGQVEVEKRYR